MGCFFTVVAIIIIILVCLNVKQHNKMVNERLSRELEEWKRNNGFETSGSFSYLDSVRGKGIDCLIDETNRKILIYNSFNGDKELIPFDKIIGMDVVENGTSVGGLGRAVTGGILFGGVGAIVGANTRKDKLTTYKIALYLNNISSPIYEISLIDVTNAPVEYTRDEYSKIKEFETRLTGTIRAIVAQNEGE